MPQILDVFIAKLYQLHGHILAATHSVRAGALDYYHGVHRCLISWAELIRPASRHCTFVFNCVSNIMCGVTACESVNCVSLARQLLT